MLGAIIGDIIGSPYEFGATKDFNFQLFTPISSITDDSIMTAAVASALMSDPLTDEAAETELVNQMRQWGKIYPDPEGGYGDRFQDWLNSYDPVPYGSYGNGSAMRVSSAGYLYDTLEATLHWAEVTARVTHNHEEGIKGACATAAAIFFARSGYSPEQIATEITKRFEYDLTRSVAEIRPGYEHDESCQRTVPEAITCALEANSYEEAVRFAVSLGGDADTLGAIAGSIAEARFGIEPAILEEALPLIPADILLVVQKFNERVLKENS